MTARILYAALTAVVFSLPALADDSDKDRTEATFKALDANGDNKLSRDEVAGDQSVARNFAMLDRNSDGNLNKKEFAAQSKHQSNDNSDMNRDSQKPPY